MRRYAAVLLLREMAEAAPAVFNVHVRTFIDAIFNGLFEDKLIVREGSVAALRVSFPFFLFGHCLAISQGRTGGRFTHPWQPIGLMRWTCIWVGSCH